MIAPVRRRPRSHKCAGRAAGLEWQAVWAYVCPAPRPLAASRPQLPVSLSVLVGAPEKKRRRPRTRNHVFVDPILKRALSVSHLTLPRRSASCPQLSVSVLAVVAVFLKLLQLMFLESVPLQMWSFAQVGKGFRCGQRHNTGTYLLVSLVM